MTPDDPRHGSWAGYQVGCRDECCATAAWRYQKGRVLDAHRGRPRMVSALGTRRRVQALACVGWTGYDIAIRLGHGREWIRQVTMRDTIWRSTADAIANIYDDLCMVAPPVDTHSRRAIVSRTKNRAQRNGWAPPLAWDDIDADAEPRTTSISDDTVDPVVVERLLAGQHIPSTPAEKAEAMRRWLADGRSQRSLCAMHGWKEGRYVPPLERVA